MSSKPLLLFIILIVFYGVIPTFCFNEIEPECITKMQDKIYYVDPSSLVKHLFSIGKDKKEENNPHKSRNTDVFIVKENSVNNSKNKPINKETKKISKEITEEKGNIITEVNNGP